MNKQRTINIEEIIKANQMMIEKRTSDLSKLSRTSQSIIRNFSISPIEINRAFAKARKEVESI